MEKVLIGDATLYHGDCVEVMRGFPECFRVGLLLTDPPFGIGNFIQVTGKKGGRGGNVGKPVTWNSAGPSEEWFDLVRRIAPERIIWGANYFNCFERDGGAIIWDKKQTAPNFSKAEIASCTRYKKTEIVHIQWTNFIVAHKAKTDHPCERPVSLYKWCMNYLPTTGAVLDTFMGSGSTGVACAELNRKFIGIEIERKYFDIACERIDAAQRQMRLFA